MSLVAAIIMFLLIGCCFGFCCVCYSLRDVAMSVRELADVFRKAR